LTAACSVAAIAASFWLGTLVDSPWQEALTNSQRDPLVTVPVETRVLTADVVESEGRFSAGEVLSITAPVSDRPGVVTARALEPGEHLGSGAVLAEVSGRPIIGLETPFRLYRDIMPGDFGPDVVAVQDALREIGLYSGRSDGKYGADTAGAVGKLYEQLGYPVLADQDLADTVDGAESGRSDVSATSPEEVRFTELPPLRAAEFVRLPERGATVLSAAAVGDEVGGGTYGGSDTDEGTSDTSSGELVRLRTGRPNVTVRVGVPSKGAFSVGAEVLVRVVTDQQISASATVRQVSGFRQPDATTPGGLPGYDVTLGFPDGADVPFEDSDTVVAVPKEDAEPKAEGLAVPLIALREDSSGTFVTVIGRGSTPVTVKATGDGFAVIEAEGLKADDQVVVSGLAMSGDES
jgi:peptidoglycan hydrolase-like protein with peptidoglycan-binding domain